MPGTYTAVPHTHECDACEGTGRVDGYCSGCSGSGEGYTEHTRCSSCRGSGSSVDDCDECDGGTVNECCGECGRSGDELDGIAVYVRSEPGHADTTICAECRATMEQQV